MRGLGDSRPGPSVPMEGSGSLGDPLNRGLLFGELRSGTGNTCSGEHQAGLMGCGRSCHQRAEGAGHGGLTQWGRCICGNRPGQGCPSLAGRLLALDCAWLLTPGVAGGQEAVTWTSITFDWEVQGEAWPTGRPAEPMWGVVRTVPTSPCPSAPQGSPAQRL